MREIARTVALACVLVVVAAPAFAADGETIPHGGYSSSTDACLQCHDIHEAAGDYVLMRQSTMTAVCGTCHTLFQQAPTGAFEPGYSGSSAGAVADSRAYKVDPSAALTHEGHRLGLGAGTYTFADGQLGDGSYIPGGTDALTAVAYLGYPATETALTYEATNGMSCASCHAPHGTYGNVVPLSVSDKILSSKPNHAPAAVTMTSWVDEGGKWCASCHDRRMQSEVTSNHPDYACLTCHGDPLEDPDPDPDFPHSGGVANLITLEPDMLCIQCHAKGTLP
jgi:predicted CXXCH cytochrome family protein